MTHRLFLLALAVCIPAASSAAHAQDDKDDKSCSKAARIIAKGHPEHKEEWAYAVIGRCPGGAGVLAAAWSPLPSDSSTFANLISGSADLADRRILDAALGAFADAALPPTRRRDILNVIIFEYAPDRVVSDGLWNDPEHGILASRMDFYQQPGEQPLTAADRQRILDSLRAASTNDPDLHMRRVLARIVHDLTT